MSITGALLSAGALGARHLGMSFQATGKPTADPSAIGSTSQPVSLASLRPGQLPGDGTYGWVGTSSRAATARRPGGRGFAELLLVT